MTTGFCNNAVDCKEKAGIVWVKGPPHGGSYEGHVNCARARCKAQDIPMWMWDCWFAAGHTIEANYPNPMSGYFAKERYILNMVPSTVAIPPNTPGGGAIVHYGIHQNLYRFTNNAECSSLRHNGWKPLHNSMVAAVGKENTGKWFGTHLATARVAATNTDCLITCQLVNAVDVLRFDIVGANLGDPGLNYMFKTKQNEATNIHVSFRAFGGNPNTGNMALPAMAPATRFQDQSGVTGCGFAHGGNAGENCACP